MKMGNSACHFLMILTLTFDIYFTQGLIWISKPSTVNKCIGQTANLTWEYTKEPGEDVKQLRWLFNRTELIAYSSAAQGFNVELKYKGRVDESGETGILLKNISTSDMGNYTFYPYIAWETSPNMHTVELNVIEPIMEQECSCEKLPQWNNGQMYSIMASGCHLEINSSFCCPKGPAIEYCKNDPQKLCVPINPNEAPTGSTELGTILHDLHINKCIIIFVLVTNCVMCILVCIVPCYFCYMHVLKRRRQKIDKRHATQDSRAGDEAIEMHLGK